MGFKNFGLRNVSRCEKRGGLHAGWSCRRSRTTGARARSRPTTGRGSDRAARGPVTATASCVETSSCVFVHLRASSRVFMRLHASSCRAGLRRGSGSGLGGRCASALRAGRKRWVNNGRVLDASTAAQCRAARLFCAYRLRPALACPVLPCASAWSIILALVSPAIASSILCYWTCCTVR